MQIDYVSDTHIDFWISELNTQNPKFQKQLSHYIDTVLKPKGSDILILAGDIGHYFKQDTEFILGLKKHYKHILLTFGNHDMYLVTKSTQNKYLYDSMNRLLEFKHWCKKQENIHFLDGNSVVIEGTSFAGAGMAWDGSYGKKFYNLTEYEMVEHWKQVMNDSKLIFSGKPHISVPTAYGGNYTECSFDPLEFFKEQKKKLNRIEYCDVMISHYGPKVPDNLKEEYKNRTSSFYYFDGLEDIDRLGCKFWVYGHTHEKIDEIYNECNLLCSPIGYPGENKSTEISTFNIG